MKNYKLLTKTIINLLLILVLGIGVTYAWFINDKEITKNMVIQNGLINELNINLYRGYDYDLNGTLDLMNTSADNDLDRYYMNITSATSDKVTDIMEASVVTYRVVLTNNSDRLIAVNPYFIFYDTVLDNTLINNYTSILFNLNMIRIITNVGSNGELTITQTPNKSLCFYRDKEIIKKEVLVYSNSTTYFDFSLKAANLTEMNNALNTYLTYSQTRNYDLNKGLYLDVNKNVYTDNNQTNIFTITNGVDIIELDQYGKADRYVSLNEYKNNDYSTLYTNDYLEFLRVYTIKQDTTTHTAALEFTVSKICFDAKYITGNEYSTLTEYNNLDLSNYTYLDSNETSQNTFYKMENGELSIILSTYNISNGLFDANGNKIYTMYDSSYTYSLIYENNEVVEVLMEVTP